MRVMLAGLGAVGTRAARALLATGSIESLTVVDPDHRRVALLLEALGERVVPGTLRSGAVPEGTDVLVIATPLDGPRLAATGLASGAHVVAALDAPHEVRALLALDPSARRAGRVLAIGVTMAPGLSCLLARQAGGILDHVEEIHVASFGTGGPTCARSHHRALHSVATEWHDSAWRRRPGGSGRELVWFPEPVGGADCYRAGLVDPLLLRPAFPEATRISARLAATRRDRLSAALPMLRAPHPEGTTGAVRVEARGRLGGAAETVTVGAFGRPALVAGTLAALSARWAFEGLLGPSGAGGLAALVERPGPLLEAVAARGIALSRFDGLSLADGRGDGPTAGEDGQVGGLLGPAPIGDV